MKRAILILTVLLFAPALRAQENTFHLNVLAYQWTTSHQTLTFTWPGHADTSCSGSVDMSGSVSNWGNFSASGTTSNTCSTIYTPPRNQNIDVKQPVVFILAETETSRMVLTCTRLLRWSQCHALNPGLFLARTDHGNLEVHAVFGKGKEQWVKFNVVQKTAIRRQEPPTLPPQEARPSIEAPKSETSEANLGFASRWKSLTSGTVRMLRFQGEYIYGELLLPEAAARAGAFTLMDVKKDGEKYVGKFNGKTVNAMGASCPFSGPVELTLVTKERIEGRSFSPPLNAKIVDWKKCEYSDPPAWQPFVWIPTQ